MRCDRIDAGAMLGSLGEGMDPHLQGCVDCREIWAAYTRLAAALGHESGRPVPGHWMDWMQARLATHGLRGSGPSLRVVAPEMAAERAAVPAAGPSRRSARASRRRSGWWIGGGFAAGAAVASAVTVALHSAPAASFRTLVELGPVRYRSASDARHPGDVLRVEARPGDAAHFELRVYLDGERLVLRCPGSPEPACRPDEEGVTASYTFERPGLYEVYWLVSSSAMSAPLGALEQDLDAVFEAGGTLRARERFHVD